MNSPGSELRLAYEVALLLDGLSLEEAQRVLSRVQRLIAKSSIVSKLALETEYAKS